MKPKAILAIAAISVLLAGAAGIAIAAQDKYTVQVPDGLAFSEVRGFEAWQTIAVSHSIDLNLVEVILGNPAMIEAYQSGLPAAGKQFPDGVKMAKIHWNATKSDTAPGTTIVPGTLHDVDIMVKDSKRFPKTGGWGWSEFDYGAASDTFKPYGTGSACGFECHTRVAARDYVFTSYGKR
jgi:hypothetical protein